MSSFSVLCLVSCISWLLVCNLKHFPHFFFLHTINEIYTPLHYSLPKILSVAIPSFSSSVLVDISSSISNSFYFMRMALRSFPYLLSSLKLITNNRYSHNSFNSRSLTCFA